MAFLLISVIATLFGWNGMHFFFYFSHVLLHCPGIAYFKSRRHNNSRSQLPHLLCGQTLYDNIDRAPLIDTSHVVIIVGGEEEDERWMIKGFKIDLNGSVAQIINV